MPSVTVSFKRILLAALLFLLLPCAGLRAMPVGDSAFIAREDSLMTLRRMTLQAEEQFVRFNVNEMLIDYWMETLNTPGSVNYTFPNIDSMYIVTSSDKNLRIITWHMLNEDFRYDFFAVVQVYSERRDRHIVYELHDKLDQLTTPEYERLREGDWIGAIYYDIIEVEAATGFFDRLFNRGRTYYTLLGWNGNDLRTDIKLIEVAILQSNGDITFGHTLFRTRDPSLRRIMFEYSSRSPLILRYEYQYLVKDDSPSGFRDDRRQAQRQPQRAPTPQPRRAHEREFQAQQASRTQRQRQAARREMPDMERKKMIVFQRLMPMRPELDGIPSQMIPHSEDYAAFIYEEGRWTYRENVEAFNPPSDKDNYQRDYNSYRLFDIRR